MKRAIAVVALALAVAALPGLAGAGLDLSLQDPPGAPHIGTALCLPASPGGQLSCPTPDPVAKGTPALESTTAVVPAAPPVATPAVPVSPAPTGTVLSVADPAYGARLHSELCAARPVFCDVDQSGHYINQ